jgi:hypothetical protein
MEGKALLPRNQKPHPQCRGEECEERGQGAHREPISWVGGQAEDAVR